MITKRIIPCLDVRNGRVVKGTNFEGIKDVADPVEMARLYNAAGADELESLPGIGPVLAQRIVDYRTEHGPFRSAEELMQVEGIGRATVESIQDHIITEDRVE